MGYVYYHLTLFYVSNCLKSPAVGYWDTEIKVPSVENPELTNVLPLTSGVGEDVAMRALPSAGTVFLVLISTSRSTYLHFVHTLSLVKCVSGVGLRNRNRSACSSLQPIDAGSRVECPWSVNRLRNMYDCVS